MRILSPRHVLISSAAIAGAMLWGAIEFIALQWSVISERLHRIRGLRTV